MTALGLRMSSALTRLFVVAGLAASLFVGSLAMGQPSHASAARYTCAQAKSMGDFYFAMGQLYYAWGDMSTSRYYYGKAEAYYDFC